MLFPPGGIRLTLFLTRQVWPISFPSSSYLWCSTVSLTDHPQSSMLRPEAGRKLHYSHAIHRVMKVGHVELSRLLHHRTWKHPRCQQVTVNTWDQRRGSLLLLTGLYYSHVQVSWACGLLIELLLAWISGIWCEVLSIRMMRLDLGGPFCIKHHNFDIRAAVCLFYAAIASKVHQYVSNSIAKIV